MTEQALHISKKGEPSNKRSVLCAFGIKKVITFKSSTLWGAALFVFRGFYGAVKEGIRTARAPRFASRGAETPQWGVSRAWLGEFLRAHSKTSLQCVFAMRFFFNVILVLESF